ENIVFLYHGSLEWQGNKDEIMTSDNQRLNDFIFASDFSKRLREANE
ncbi:MAG TPA: ABC transporter ATP-binding protein, partial [Prevotellaceae bacterium]|nr:ABC transporter ATP-binding protein [Prevotellaceae bacterium]